MAVSQLYELSLVIGDLQEELVPRDDVWKMMCRNAIGCVNLYWQKSEVYGPGEVSTGNSNP
jgi:hypothetical protein